MNQKIKNPKIAKPRAYSLESDGLNKIIQGDCMEILPGIPDKYFSIALVDPPYGLFADKKNNHMAWSRAKKEAEGGTWSTKYGRKSKDWDIMPGPEYFDELRRVSVHQIIFGANHFGFPFDNYIVWEKGIAEKFSMGMIEVASVSCPGNPKLFKFRTQDPTRFHPTQKPVNLYRKIIQEYAKAGDKILDTHSGSGSCACACHLENLEFLSIEKDPEYFQLSIDRLAELRGQGRLF